MRTYPATTIDGTALGMLTPADACRGRSCKINFGNGRVLTILSPESMSDEADRLLREDRERRKAATPPMPAAVKARLNSPEERLLANQRREARSARYKAALTAVTLKCATVRRKV